MDGKRLLALYDQVVEAPDAVSQLRRFILNLAVRGKLVKQNPADEPASELLKRITTEKARFANAGKGRRNPKSHRPAAAAPFGLPQSWEWAPIGRIFLYDAGIKRAPVELDPSLWLLELEDIEKESGRLIARVHARDRKSKSTKSEFQQGDILYGKLRPYLNKVLVADSAGYSTTEIVAIRPIAALNPEYCALALRRPDFVDYVTRLGQGTKMPRLRRDDALNAPFPLAPVAEQRRIVAKVDELMALCDQLEQARVIRKETRAQLTKTTLARLSEPDANTATFRSHARFAIEALPALTTHPDQLKNIRQTILNLAVRGRLVEQDSDDPPASALLKQVRSRLEARAKTVRRVRWKTTQPVACNEVVKDIPAGWVSARINDTGLYVNGLAFKPADWKQSGLPIIRIQNLTDPAKEFNFAEGDFPDEVLVRDGDLLVSWSATLEAFKWDRGKAVLNQHIFRVLPEDQLTTRDFLLVLLRNAIQEMAESDHAHGLVMKHINRGPFLNQVVMIPPIAEQRRIAAKVDELMALCDQLEDGLGTLHDTKTRLLDSALAETVRDAA